jgi:hypothetical protein
MVLLFVMIDLDCTTVQLYNCTTVQLSRTLEFILSVKCQFGSNNLQNDTNKSTTGT